MAFRLQNRYVVNVRALQNLSVISLVLAALCLFSGCGESDTPSDSSSGGGGGTYRYERQKTLCTDSLRQSYEKCESAYTAFMKRVETAPVDWYEELSRREEAKKLLDETWRVTYDNYYTWCTFSPDTDERYFYDRTNPILTGIEQWQQKHSD